MSNQRTRGAGGRYVGAKRFMLQAGVIDTCGSVQTARLVLARIEHRVCDAQIIGWPTLERAWNLEMVLARAAMTRRGWV